MTTKTRDEHIAESLYIVMHAMQATYLIGDSFNGDRDCFDRYCQIQERTADRDGQPEAAAFIGAARVILSRDATCEQLHQLADEAIRDAAAWKARALKAEREQLETLNDLTRADNARCELRADLDAADAICDGLRATLDARTDARNALAATLRTIANANQSYSGPCEISREEMQDTARAALARIES